MRRRKHLLDRIKAKRVKKKTGTKLGGLWKGIKITDDEIKKGRQELLEKLEEKW